MGIITHPLSLSINPKFSRRLHDETAYLRLLSSGHDLSDRWTGQIALNHKLSQVAAYLHPQQIELAEYFAPSVPGLCSKWSEEKVSKNRSFI